MSKYLVAGISHMSGVSERGQGSAYDMKRAVVLSEQAPVDSKNRTLESIGLNAVDMNLSDECFRKFQNHKASFTFPCEIDFVSDVDLSTGQARVVFTDFKLPANATKAP